MCVHVHGLSASYTVDCSGLCVVGSSSLGLVCFGLVSLFIQGKPLASGYYSRNPETTQYNKDKDKEKRKTEERTQKSKSTCAANSRRKFKM